jgi:hypothetical protein
MACARLKDAAVGGTIVLVLRPPDSRGMHSRLTSHSRGDGMIACREVRAARALLLRL